MDRDKARSEIEKLVAKYNKVVEENRVKKYNEEMTKLGFIQPLFRALGWDIEDSKEVTAEEKISKGRVDYGFRIDGIPKFFLEAKSLKADLDKEEYFEQAISYAWHKGCTWAVLTDFEAVKILNAEWKAANYLQSHFRTITCYEFLDRFDELWLLSKESFEKGSLDKQAERLSKKTKKASIDEQLLEDFTRYRRILTKSITKLNQKKKLTEDELDESVQRILDRLIFIRNCEDKELEEKLLISKLREWESKGKGKFVNSLREIFHYFDKEYNSKIFSEHLCDNLEIENEVLSEIIKGLYYTQIKFFKIYYDFSVIDADVLGNIYEQYLSHILKKTAKRARITEKKIHRKEQGIYYTPTYIVDYIVRNTLGKKLQSKKIDVEKIRVLDPACGSGSFLTKAFDIFDEYYTKNSKDYAQTQLDEQAVGIPFTKKAKILQDNIFGVDLDKQAVEIAQLNLLLKIAEKGHRLPILGKNIKIGNSLIDDKTVAEKKAFNWDNEFADLMEKGGFDIVIGNPPYVRQEELLPIKDYLEANYEVFNSVADLYVYFFERGIKNLKEGGYFGIIVSNKWLKAGYGNNLRKFLKSYWIKQFIDFGDLDVFHDATTYPCIIIIRKINKQNPKIIACNVKTLNFDNLENYVKLNHFTFNQKDLDNAGWNFKNQKIGKMIEKINKNCITLSECVNGNIRRGILSGFNKAFIINRKLRDQLISKDPKNIEIIKPFISGKELKRYHIDSKDKYIIFTRRGIDIGQYPTIEKHLSQFRKDLTPKKSKEQKRGRKQGDYKWYEIQDSIAYYEDFTKPKIIYGEVQVSPKFTIDLNGLYLNKTIFLIPKNDFALLALLNSKMFWFLIQNYCNRVQGGYILSWKYLGRIPVPKRLPYELNELSKKMLSLHEKTLSLKDKRTDERLELEKTIEETDIEIDQLVYRVYGITEKEQKIIEEE